MNYNEEPRQGTGRILINILLKSLLIIIFIFILVWLFPTKNSLNPLYQEIFRNNIDAMKEAATTYFTNERLPKNVGDSEKLTLREMLEMNLLLPFVDKYDKQCDLDNSYVEITKTETEYELKVSLSCSKESAFIIEHLGCTDKCQEVCTENAEEVTYYEFTREVNNKQITGYKCDQGYTLNGKLCTKVVTNTDKKDATPVYKTNTTLVDATTKEETIKKYLYKYGKERITTKEIEDINQPIRHYTYDNVIGYSTKTVCTNYKYFIDNNSQGLYQHGAWKLQERSTMTTIPNDTIDTKYVVVGMDYDKCMNTCTLKPYYLVDIYKRTVSQELRNEDTLKVECETSTKQVPIYGLKITFLGYVKDKVTTSEKLYEWAETPNDAKLLADNYGYLNIKKEAEETKTTYVCPKETKPTDDQTKCSKTESTLTGYKCDKDYTLNDKICTKTTTKTDTKNATPVYKTVKGTETKWTTTQTLEGWKATGRTKTEKK